MKSILEIKRELEALEKIRDKTDEYDKYITRIRHRLQEQIKFQCVRSTSPRSN